MEVQKSEFAIFCADVGSISRGNFGWASSHGDGTNRASGTSIEQFADAVAQQLSLGQKVALGFECPLFVPLPENPIELTRARQGEGSKAWSAGAGSGSLSTGLTESAWVFRHIHRVVSPEPRLFFDWEAFAHSQSGLFLWEAFVSGASKAKSHEGDANLAVTAFLDALPDPMQASVISENLSFSLIAAAALRGGWSSAAAMIDQPCLVIAAK